VANFVLPPRRPVDTVMAEQRAASFTKRSIKKESKRAGLRLAREGSGLVP
jgi:hypothetical protein